MTIIILCFIVLAGVSCASLPTRPVDIRDLQQYQNRTTEKDRTVAVDVYNTKEKYRTVFQTRPTLDIGFLPLNLIIYNHSKGAIRIDTPLDTIEAITIDGTLIKPIDAAGVVEEAARKMSESDLASGTLGVISADQAKEKMRKELSDRQLKGALIYPKRSASGFLWFSSITL